MSDVAQAPDWWLASDGKWYPPQSRPVSAPVGRRPGLAPALSGWMQGLLWAAGAVYGIHALLVFAVFGASTNYESDPGLDTLVSWSDLEDTANGWLTIAQVTALAVFVLIIIWGFQAHKAAETLSPGRRSWGRSWSIAGWFIPLANAVIPFLVISETQKIGDANRRGGIADPNWKRNSRVSPLGLVWWIVFIGSWVIGSISGGLTPSGDSLSADLSTYQASYLLGALASALRAASGVLGALYVRSVARTLSPNGLSVRDTVVAFVGAPLPPPPASPYMSPPSSPPSAPPPPAWPGSSSQ